MIRRKEKAMPVLPINVYGDKILRKKVELVKEIDFETIRQIKDMFETMRQANGVGLAANQVGLDKAMFVIDVSPVEGYEKIKPVVMINPRIVLTSDEQESYEEGCLSLPLLRADVIRPKEVKVVFFDTDMKEQSIEADKFFARVIQHEFDHLQGIFFTDKLNGAAKKNIKEELMKIQNRLVDVDYPITSKN